MEHFSKTPWDQVREIAKLVDDASDLLHQVSVALESLKDRLDEDGSGTGSAEAAAPDDG